jgi:hypothetical protein
MSYILKGADGLEIRIPKKGSLKKSFDKMTRSLSGVCVLTGPYDGEYFIRIETMFGSSEIIRGLVLEEAET